LLHNDTQIRDGAARHNEIAEESSAHDARSICYYCGSIAGDIDHVVPKIVLKMLSDLGDEEVRRRLINPNRILTVAACHECNVLLGASYFDTLAERKNHLKQKLKKRYARLLSMPEWTEDEIKQLRGRMRDHIRGEMARRALMRQRIAW
jgi:hypothetical protein